MDWAKAQELELKWWGNCANTFGEEMKQFVYAEKMGITTVYHHDSPYNFQVPGKKILDIGGGPCSMLLKTPGLDEALVVDPCSYPVWVRDRYADAGILYMCIPAENFLPVSTVKFYDEAWIYNVLQHVQDPAKVIENAKKFAKLIRIFEWVNAGTNEMHPHKLTQTELDVWIGQKGNVEFINKDGARGQCYYGVFKT